tara:strand:+ start:834 stop:1013 length:180 start_codon:yes stop_codon:yes gene_type:complete
MTTEINNTKKEISLKSEKIIESEKIIKILHSFIKNDVLYTSDMLQEIKKHCKDLLKSDY